MKQFLFTMCAFVLFIPIAPLIGVIFISLVVYRAVVTGLIKLCTRKHFRGFLEGLDAIWNVETGSSRSMLNLMFFLESSPEGHAEIPEKFLTKIRQTVSVKLMGTVRPYPRLFWSRRQTMGFCYWSDRSSLTIEDFVRYIQPINGEQFIQEVQLREQVAKISNQLLPDNHAACWELLIGQQPVKGTSDQSIRYPVILRFHHTAGDGMAIVRLVLDTITGNHDALAARITPPSQGGKSSAPQKKQRPSITQVLKVLLHGPAYLLRMMLQKSENGRHSLSGGKITEDKVVSWCHEQESEQMSIIEIVKSTKQLVPGARFSDVLLVALSSSLQRYFASKGESCPPGGVSVIIPGRAGSEAKSLKIKNRFTTRRQQLKIHSGLQMTDSDNLTKLKNHLSSIAQSSTTTRSASSHFITSLFISSLCNLLPVGLLRFVAKSFRVNMVFSILPEIEKVSFEGLEMVGPTLFLPNTGSISVCLAIVTFGQRMHLGILADRSVIPLESDAHLILEGIVDEVQRMGIVLEKNKKSVTVGYENE